MKPREVDPSVRDLDCECPSCPSEMTVFSFRTSPDMLEAMCSSPDTAFFVCPRGHEIKWLHVRSTFAVDTAGYIILPDHNPKEGNLS